MEDARREQKTEENNRGYVNTSDIDNPGIPVTDPNGNNEAKRFLENIPD